MCARKLAALAVWIVAIPGGAQESRVCDVTLVFYNVQNLFDAVG